MLISLVILACALVLLKAWDLVQTTFLNDNTRKFFRIASIAIFVLAIITSAIFSIDAITRDPQINTLIK